jgi:hypothetical protein
LRDEGQDEVMPSGVSNWQHLRSEIWEAPDRAKELDGEITEALYRYRFHLTELRAKPHKLDRRVWTTYDAILADIKELRARSDGRLLHKPSTLISLRDEWQAVFARQRALVRQIEQTIARSSFYNKMETAKESKSRERAQLAKARAKLFDARRGVIQAVHYVLLRERSGESITSDSIVLDLDEAIESWEEQLREILAYQMQGEISDAEEIYLLESLRQQIVEAPHWAEKLKKVESDFDELLVLEDQLRRIAGSGQLADGDIGEMVNLLQQDARSYWAEARWDELKQVLDQIIAYVQRELPPLHSQLYVLRKRTGNSPLTWAGSAAMNKPAQSERSGSNGSKRAHAGGQGEETHEDPTPDSILRELSARSASQMHQKVYIDPDADESIRLVYQSAVERDQESTKPLAPDEEDK